MTITVEYDAKLPRKPICQSRYFAVSQYSKCYLPSLMTSFTNAGAFKTVTPASIPAFPAAGAQLYALASPNLHLALTYVRQS